MQAPSTIAENGYEEKAVEEHPAGKVKHGGVIQVLRCLLIVSYFLAGCCRYLQTNIMYFIKPSNWINSIVTTQLIGAPLYWIDMDLYYAYMALTKQSFLLLITTITQWSGPTLIRVSGDESVSGQIRRTADGAVEYSFPDRIVMIANHQVMLSSYIPYQFANLPCSSIPNGCTSGGPHMPIYPRCTVISTLS
jgi:lysocardiolipin and lysophospholipid acyltransferase